MLLLPAGVRGLTFDQYLKQYRKSYEGDEYEARRALFESRRQEVAALNARPGALWRAGLNPLSDLYEHELRQRACVTA